MCSPCHMTLAHNSTTEGVRERGGGVRAEQNSGPFEMVLNFEMRRHFRGGGVANMHLL